VVIFTAISFTVTILFHAEVDAQAGAYATGVLAVITSATVAVTLSAHRRRQTKAMVGFGIVSAIFIYTTAVTIISEPEGIQIAAIFIAAVILTSLISRTVRSFELRVHDVMFDRTAEAFLAEASNGSIQIIANNPDERTSREYLLKERRERAANHIPPEDPVIFLEVTVRDASDFASVVRVHGRELDGFEVLRASSVSVPNAIAAILLDIRDRTGKRPNIYFGWTEGNPLKYLAKFLLFGEGNTAVVTHEILRQAEPNPEHRPAIHVG
jgi:hypothetical protein